MIRLLFEICLGFIVLALILTAGLAVIIAYGVLWIIRSGVQLARHVENREAVRRPTIRRRG